jgi:hypothetical protein
MSHTLTSLLLNGGQYFSYLKNNFPSLDWGIAAAMTGIVFIVIALFSVFFINSLHRWVIYTINE